VAEQEMAAYRNVETCHTCPEEKRRRCCRIYDNDDDGIRDKSVWFDEWCENFHTPQMRGSYGMEPLFDPLVVHMTGNEHMMRELEAKGVDPYACEYLGPSGCRIPWKKRPLICKLWKCDRFTEKDKIMIMVET